MTAYRSGEEPTTQIIVTTGFEVAGYKIAAYLGVVRGIVVRSPSIGQGFIGALKSIGGGNIQEFVDVCEAARHDAYVQMVEHAHKLGAHAIIGMRYDATELGIGQRSLTEVLAYGVAVWADPVG